MRKIERVEVFFGVGIIACLLGLIAFSLMHAEDIRAVGDCEPELALECEPPNVFINCQCRPPFPTLTPTSIPTPTPLAYGPKGIGDPWQNWTPPKTGTNLSALNYNWYYDWQVSYVPERENDPHYVRTVWCMGTGGIVSAASSDYANGIRGRVWLIYNEPDHPNQCGGNRVDNLFVYDNPQYAAHHFSDVYDMIKGADPYARVFGGGLVYLNTTKSYNWWRDFVLTLQTEGNLYKLEGVHVHLYPLVSTTTDEKWPVANLSCDNSSDDYCVPELAQVANQWYTKAHASLNLGDNNTLDLSDRPIWITEMGRDYGGTASGWDWSDVVTHTMEPLSQWFSGEADWPYDPQVALNPGYDSVAWFATYDSVYLCSSLLDGLGPNGTPTALGGFWNAYQP